MCTIVIVRVKMKVFISWHGALSLKVAEALRNWLPSVIQSVKPYVSSKDTHKGTRWNAEVSRELESSDYGILCVTAESLTAPWTNFEAGALSKSVEKGRVSPLLIGIETSDLTGPLVQFQSTLYQYSDFLELMKSINAVSDTPLEVTQLERTFRVWWKQLKDEIDQAIRDCTDVKKPVKTSRSTEDMLGELLDLTRTQQKLLSDLTSSASTSSSSARPRLVRDVDFTEVSYLLARVRSAVDEAVVLGKPETPKMVQLRALIMLLSDSLSPALSKADFYDSPEGWTSQFPGLVQ
jgi:TIR domain